MSNNPFVGFDPFQKQDREHPYGEDSHLDSDSTLERYGDVDTGDNYYEPDDYDEDDDFHIPLFDEDYEFQDHSESKQYIAKQEEISNFEALARVAGMISPFLAYGVGVSTAMWGKNTAKAIGEAASKIKRGQMPNKEDLQRIADAKPREGAVHEIPQEGLVKIGNAMDELRAANRQLVTNNESPAEYFSRRQEELEQQEAGRNMDRAGVWGTQIDEDNINEDTRRGWQEKVKQGRRLAAARNVGARGRGESRSSKFREGELAEWEEGLDPATRRAVSGKRDVDESGGGFRTWHPADRDAMGHPVTREDAMGQPPKNQTSVYGNAARKQPQFPPPYTGGEKGEIVTKSHDAMIKALGSAIEFMEKQGGSDTYHDPEGNVADNPRDKYKNVTSEWDLDEWDDMDAEEYPYELNVAQEEEQRQLYDNERRQTTRPSGENSAYEEIQSSADSEFAKTLGILINRLSKQSRGTEVPRETQFEDPDNPSPESLGLTGQGARLTGNSNRNAENFTDANVYDPAAQMGPLPVRSGRVGTMKRRIEAGKEAYPGFSREQNPYVDYDPEENPWEYSAEDLARGLRLGLFAFRGKPRRMSEKEADDEVAAFRERYKQSKKNYVPYKEMSESEAEENAEKEAGIKRNG